MGNEGKAKEYEIKIRLNINDRPKFNEAQLQQFTNETHSYAIRKWESATGKRRIFRSKLMRCMSFFSLYICTVWDWDRQWFCAGVRRQQPKKWKRTNNNHNFHWLTHWRIFTTFQVKIFNLKLFRSCIECAFVRLYPSDFLCHSSSRSLIRSDVIIYKYVHFSWTCLSSGPATLRSISRTHSQTRDI